MASQPWTYIPDLLEEHIEELGYLWGRRQTALRDPDYTLKDFLYIEERIAAHRDGVRAVGDLALPLLEETLKQDDPLTTFAAAYALLQFGSPSATQRVVDTFRSAKDDRLASLEDALRHGPIDSGLTTVQLLCHNGGAAVAVAAATALAFHSAYGSVANEITRFLRDEDPMVRRQGWRLVAYTGADVDPKTYAAAARDAAVRRAALEAGAWCGKQSVLAVCRKLVAEPSLETLDILELLAILGGPEDLGLFATVASTEALGPVRFRLVGTYGHPGLVDLLLAALADPDPATAAEAGAAFTKITGQNVESDRRAKLPPENGSEPDDFEAEFQDEVTLPDSELAQRHWELLKPQVGQAGRLRRSFEVDTGLTGDVLTALDMESRWEISLRARFSGAWSGSPLRLERFPQQGTS
ncbi:MAG TPA: hypothetical protein VEK77_13835 [Gemmatimonadales bacterium]|nr:hypothetical protein [Gemmatimonadales bacterium]